MINSNLPIFNLHLEKVLNKINNHLDENLSIEQLSSICGYSPFHFQRIFKEYTGESVANYVKRLRVEKAAFMLKYQYNKISTVAMRTGFNSNTSFTRAFKSYYNISPLEFKEKYKKKNEKNDIPDFKIVKLDAFQVFFIRTFGDYSYSEPLAWREMTHYFQKILDKDAQYISICYDEPTISKHCSKLRYEACILYEENKYAYLKNLTLKNIDSGTYAKFEFEGTLKEFDNFFYSVYETFFHNRNYQISLKPAIQIHHNSARDLLFGETRTDLLIPLD